MILHRGLIHLLNPSEFKGKRQISVDSTDALPKAKAKVIIKKPKVQSPGHVPPISVPTPAYEGDEDDGPSHEPQAPSSHDHLFHCRQLRQRHMCEVITRSQININPHKEHQNWHHLKTMMKQNRMTLMTLLF